MSIPWDCILIFLFMIIFDALFTLCENSADILPKIQKKAVTDEENEDESFFEKHPERFSATVKAGTYLVSAFCAAYVIPHVTKAFKESVGISEKGPFLQILAFVAVVFVFTVLALIFGFYIPKRIAIIHEKKLVRFSENCLRFFYYLLSPTVFIVSFLGRLILKIFGVDEDKIEDEVTEEEIRKMIDAGNESGNIEESEKDMLHNIFEFDDRECDEIMTHRTELTAVGIDTPIEEIVDIAMTDGYSRIPVYKEDLDDIVGLLYVKDLISLLKKKENETDGFDIRDYIRPTIYVPGSAKVKELFSQFQKTHIQMAVVIDEYGGTSGIVTMEDLVECVMGSIMDEYDDEKDEKNIEPIAENEYAIKGTTPIHEVEELFDTSLVDENDDCDTLAGFIIGKLGQIPTENEHPKITEGKLEFTVESVTEHRIERVSARLCDTYDTDEQSEGQKQ